MTRNMSPWLMFLEMAQKHRPRYAFQGQTREEWREWKARALPEVLETLGRVPGETPPNGETVAEWESDGVVMRRDLIDVQPGLSAALLINRPLHATAENPLPAILCCHGHGPYGKEAVMGNRASAEIRAHIADANYDYGLEMAKAGFVTFAIDWMGFGERNEDHKPNPGKSVRQRDWCNMYYLLATMLGMTVLGLDVHHGKAAIDYVSGLPLVDEERLGVMGLSFGGTMTVWMTLADQRIRATDIICYSDRFPRFGFRDLNTCGSQITPGLFSLVDLPDLQGLIAPRPLLVEIGARDDCFRLDDAMSCYRQVERVYRMAGCPDRLELDLFDGGHGWGGNRSVDFFRTHLAGSAAPNAG
jgi:dienelactone hydrolase